MMKKILHKLYGTCIMHTSHNKYSEWINTQVISILKYILFPEFRKYNIGLLLKRIRIIFGVYVAGSLLIGLESMRVDLNNTRDDLKTSVDYITDLQKNAKSILYKEIKDSVLMSPEYLKYRIFVESGCKIPKSVKQEHLVTMVKCSQNENIPFGLFMRLIQTESGFDSAAVSSVGAFGYMQTMPATFNQYYKMLKLDGGRSALNNIIVGTAVLSDLHTYWHKKYPRYAWQLTLASYNIGQQNVIDIGRVPDACKDYVKKILL